MRLKFILLAAAALLTACSTGDTTVNTDDKQPDPITSTTEKTTAAEETADVTATEEPVKEPYPEANPEEDFEYFMEEMYYGGYEVRIKGYNGSSPDVVIPETIEDWPVVEIGKAAFKDNTLITSVTVPESVDTIGQEAFYGCKGLVAVTLYNHDSLRLGVSAFHYCESLTSINLPEYMDGIPVLGFACCSSLTQIDIPGNIYYIGDSAFISCTSLSRVGIYEGEKIFGLEKIGPYAFADCPALESVYIPSTVEKVELMAFGLCRSLSDVTIADGVQEIHAGAFFDCRAMTELTVPDSVVSIGEGSIGFQLVEGSEIDYEPVPSFTLYCSAGSAAEEYAIEYDVPYTII